MIDPARELSQALAAISCEFRENELAYLALTTKVELPFRDRIAFRLHQDYAPAGCIVAREWNRIDLAVLASDGSPLCLVELKAMYTFDAMGNLRFFTDATTADEQKARQKAGEATSVFSLLLVTHLDRLVPEAYLKPVKYSGGINRALLRWGDAHAVRAKASAEIEGGLAGRCVVARGHVEGGAAFGIGVSVLYWLVRNEERDTKLSIGG